MAGMPMGGVLIRYCLRCIKFWTSLPHDGLTMKVSPRVVYTLYSSAPTDRFKAKLLQEEPLMFGKTLWKQLSFGRGPKIKITKRRWQKLPTFKICNQWSYSSCENQIFVKTAVQLNKFLVLYQTKKPMVPFFTQSLEDIIHSFASTFMLAEKLKTSKACLSLCKIIFKDPSCHKRATDFNPWISIKTELSDLKKSRKISDTQFLMFKFGVVSFLSVLGAHLVEVSPTKYSLTRNPRCSKHLKPARKYSISH